MLNAGGLRLTMYCEECLASFRGANAAGKRGLLSGYAAPPTLALADGAADADALAAVPLITNVWYACGDGRVSTSDMRDGDGNVVETQHRGALSREAGWTARFRCWQCDSTWSGVWVIDRNDGRFEGGHWERERDDE